jgi:hypothetical protein
MVDRQIRMHLYLASTPASFSDICNHIPTRVSGITSVENGQPASRYEHAYAGLADTDRCCASPAPFFKTPRFSIPYFYAPYALMLPH